MIIMGKNEIKKIKYEQPAILNLGEMAKGVGLCNPSGSGNTGGSCDAVGGAAATTPCGNGNSNSSSVCNGTGNNAVTGPGVCNTGTGNTGVACSAGPAAA